MNKALASHFSIHGWQVFAHPVFLGQIETLIGEVAALRQKDPSGYRKKNPSKRLAAIAKLAFDVIPQDPARSEYRQGNSLGDAHKHWFRAKFFQQYRLFFRYHAASKIIVLACHTMQTISDEETKRAYESSGDAYPTFQKMRASGKPPDDWAQLLQEAKAAQARSQASMAKAKPDIF